MTLARQILLDFPVGYWPLDEPYYALDGFTRANSTTTLGVADSGQSWVPKQGTWGISSNKAYEPSPANADIALLDTGKSDLTFECDLLYRDDGDGIVFRSFGATVTDGFLVYPDAGSLHCLNPGFASDPPGTPVSRSHTVGTTYHYRVEAYGTSIKVYEDGTLVINTTSSTNQTATWIGLRSGGTTGTKRWSNLKVYGLAKDRSGNGRDGTYTNGPVLGTRNLFVSPTFDGTDDYVLLPNNAAFLTSTWTLETWARLTTVPGSDIAGLLTYGGASPNGWNRYIRVNSGTLECGYASGSAVSPVEQKVTGPASFPANQWQHITYTHDGTTSRIYVNGVSSWSAALSAAPINSTGGQEFAQMGRWSATSTWLGTGRVAHTVMFGSVLSAGRIKAHYEAGIRDGVSV